MVDQVTNANRFQKMAVYFDHRRDATIHRRDPNSENGTDDGYRSIQIDQNYTHARVMLGGGCR